MVKYSFKFLTKRLGKALWVVASCTVLVKFRRRAASLVGCTIAIPKDRLLSILKVLIAISKEKSIQFLSFVERNDSCFKLNCNF